MSVGWPSFAVHHERDELGAARGIELLKYPVEVGLDRVLAQNELGCNFFIRVALAHVFDDLFLSRRDAVYLAGL